MRKIILYIFLLLPCICLAQATDKRGVHITEASLASEGTTYAVVIGISKYKDVTQLKFADRDAKIFSDFLINRNGMALDSNNVKVFLNEKATLNNIGNALSDIITKNLKKGDRIIFFFAGHGDYDANILKDQALLLLYGAPKQNYFQNIFSGDFISTADLNSRFIEPLSSKGCEVTLIIDACHATGMNKNLSGGAEGGKITMMALENMTSPVKIYSCKANQYSLESEQWGGGRGLFSYVLMEGLYGMADLDNNKKISLRELRRYLEDNVAGMAAPNKQDPIIKIENDDATLVSVHDSLLALYKTEKGKSLMFLSKADTKGGDDPFLNTMDSLQKKIYTQCDSLIEAKKLDAAYQVFLIFTKKDSTSDASLQLKRNLSASLQEKAAIVLTPMLQDVSKFNSSMRYVAQAKKDLEKAASLLGKTHFLYKNLQARILFLNALYINLNGENDKARDALADLEQSVILEPNAPYTYYYLGYFYNMDNNLEKARTNYEKYLNLIPNSGWAYDNLGIVYKDLKNYDKAIFNYKKGIEMDSVDAMAYCNLGMLYEYLNKDEEAKQVYTKAIELVPDNTTAYVSLGLIYKGLKKYEESIKYFKKEIEAYPFSSIGYTDIGISYRLTNKYDSAIKSYLKAIELDSTDAYSYNNMGNVYIDLKKYAEALQYYKKAIHIKPDYPVCLNNMGIVYNKLKYYDSAIIYYQKAVEADSLYPNPHINLSNTYSTLKNFTEALKSGKKYLEFDPGNASAWFNTGLIYDNMENYDTAIINYLNAVKLDPKYESAYFNLGIIYNRQKKYGDAISSYKKAIESDSANAAPAYNNLGRIHYLLENYEEAGINYRKSVALDSAYAKGWFNLGDMFYKVKKYDESTNAYRKAVQFDTSFTSAVYSIAVNYHLLEKYDEALIYYQKYNQLKPGLSYVLKAIGDVYYNHFKNYDSSIYYFSKSYELKSDDKNIIEQLAYSFLRLGKTTDAVEMFKKEINLFPDDAWGYYNIACVFSLGNKTADALEYFKMALDKKMNELSHWETDSDLNNIRTLPEFKILLKKYFSAEELTKRPDMFVIIKK